MDPSVSDVTSRLVPAVAATLGSDLVALYVYGSAVTGGFEPGVSDVDLIAVTARTVASLDLVAIGRTHAELAAAMPEWDDRVEVVYVSRAALASFRTTSERLAVISPGEPFHLRDEPIVEWLQNWYQVRETGLALVGPPPSSLIPAVTKDEFLAATVRYAGQLAQQELAAARPDQVSYAVLTMCRAALTVATGAPASKADGAAWVSRRMPDRAWLVDEAFEARRSRGRIGLSEPHSRRAAGELINLLHSQIMAGGPCPLNDGHAEY